MKIYLVFLKFCSQILSISVISEARRFLPGSFYSIHDKFLWLTQMLNNTNRVFPVPALCILNSIDGA